MTSASEVPTPRRTCSCSSTYWTGRALARFDEADRHLRAFLTPLLAAIPADDRAALAALAAAGMAPSPFSTRALGSDGGMR